MKPAADRVAFAMKRRPRFRTRAEPSPKPLPLRPPLRLAPSCLRHPAMLPLLTAGAAPSSQPESHPPDPPQRSSAWPPGAAASPEFLLSQPPARPADGLWDLTSVRGALSPHPPLPRAAGTGHAEAELPNEACAAPSAFSQGVTRCTLEEAPPPRHLVNEEVEARGE